MMGHEEESHGVGMVECVLVGEEKVNGKLKALGKIKRLDVGECNLCFSDHLTRHPHFFLVGFLRILRGT